MKSLYYKSVLIEAAVDKNTNSSYIIKNNIKIYENDVDEKYSKKLKIENGKYYLLEEDQFGLSDEMFSDCLKDVLKELINNFNKKPKKVLIIGLGNKDVTADSLGPKVCDSILITRHLVENESLKANSVSQITPGVMGKTGIETIKIIKGVLNEIKCDLVIIIDSLSTKFPERLSNAIQITNTKITPGSGVGQLREELSKKTLNTNVIVIGVSMVLDSVSLISGYFNYINQKPKIADIKKYLTQTKIPLLICEKDVDYKIDRMVRIISKAIDNLFHDI